MVNLIEELYCGNIDPQARSSEQNWQVQRDMQILAENEDYLLDNLSDEERSASSSMSILGHPLTVNPNLTALLLGSDWKLSSSSTPLLQRSRLIRTIWKARYKDTLECSGYAHYMAISLSFCYFVELYVELRYIRYVIVSRPKMLVKEI